MALTFSTELKDAWLGDGAADGSLNELLNGAGGTTGFYIQIIKSSVARPALADTAFDNSGTNVLATIKGGGATTGCVLGSASSGIIAKNGTWTADGTVNAGTAGWFRLYLKGESAETASSSETLGYRIDGNCGDTSAADLVMASTTIVASQALTIDVFTITLP